MPISVFRKLVTRRIVRQTAHWILPATVIALTVQSAWENASRAEQAWSSSARLKDALQVAQSNLRNTIGVHRLDPNGTLQTELEANNDLSAVASSLTEQYRNVAVQPFERQHSDNQVVVAKTEILLEAKVEDALQIERLLLDRGLIISRLSLQSLDPEASLVLFTIEAKAVFSTRNDAS